MSSSTLRRLIVVLALGAFLGVPVASLAGPHSAARFSEDRTANVSLVSRLWNAVLRAWEKEGLASSSSQPASGLQKNDNGCSLDPFGRCIGGH